jgi:predicted alpha/beta-fold hydrolase
MTQISRRNFLASTTAVAGFASVTPSHLFNGKRNLAHAEPASPEDNNAPFQPVVRYKTARINDLDIFYREAGSPNAPTIILLHGFPTSSNMFRNLIPRLASSYHVIAADYPGYGQSSAPDHTTYKYSFASMADIIDKLAQQLKVNKYSLYVMD